jgi:hypothetical protein
MSEGTEGRDPKWISGEEHSRKRTGIKALR